MEPFAVHPTTGNHIVILDYVNNATDEIAVNYYDLEAQGWGATPAPAISAPPIKPLVHDIAVDGQWLFVSANQGFLVIDLTDLGSGEVDKVFTNPTDCGTSINFHRVEGISSYQDRLFVSLSGTVASDPRGAVVMYDFDSATGDVTEPPLDCVYDFPGVDVQGGGRCRSFLVAQPPFSPYTKVRVYSCTTKGHLLELEYHLDATTESLTPIATWNNGSFSTTTMDCNVYNVGTQIGMLGPVPQVNLWIVVAKYTEAFAIVQGSSVP